MQIYDYGQSSAFNAFCIKKSRTPTFRYDFGFIKKICDYLKFILLLGVSANIFFHNKSYKFGSTCSVFWVEKIDIEFCCFVIARESKVFFQEFFQKNHWIYKSWDLANWKIEWSKLPTSSKTEFEAILRWRHLLRGEGD